VPIVVWFDTVHPTAVLIAAVALVLAFCAIAKLDPKAKINAAAGTSVFNIAFI
jgi:hypothetical protein